MKYSNIHEGIFLRRPNRFIAQVEIQGKEETVHVKNTGRCKELLVPGNKVFLEKSDNPNRKTQYDLIGVIKEEKLLINMDSQAPNKVVKEWLEQGDFDLIRPEYTYGASRIDFYMERGEAKFLFEIKGCTLERNGIGYFPDAPTERGVKHIYELIEAAKKGYHCAIGFVIQMDGVTEVRPNVETHPAFGEAWKDALEAGVAILMLPCHVETDALNITCPVEPCFDSYYNK